MKKQFTFGAVSPNVAMIKNNGKPMNIGEVVDCLNEQQDIIQSLQKDLMEMSDSHQSYIEMDSETHSKMNDIIRTQRGKIFRLEKENERLKNKLNVTALELVDEVISMGKAVEVSEMSYREFIDYRAENGKPMELQL